MSLGAEIRDVLFTPVRLREGYDMGEVDALLDALAAAADRGEPLRPLIEPARFTPVRLREGYDMGEVDAFLARMAGGAVDRSAPAASTGHSVVQEQRGVLARIFRRAD